MKNYLLISIILLSGLVSCGFDDEEAVYSYTSVYLLNQDYNRNLVVGEGLELKVGVIFSGLMTNNKDRSVKYVIDPSLITDPSTQIELPASYYTLGNASDIIVPKGELKGYLPVKLDSVAFLNDPESLTGKYILPIRLVSANSIDSIMEGKDYMRVAISYFAKQHGNYTYSGKTIKNGTTEITYKNDPTETNSFRLLQTVGPRRMRVVADPTSSLDPAKEKYSFIVEVPTYEGGNVNILPDPTSPVVVSPNGESRYDVATKTFYLNYSYSSGGDDCTSSDELVFRNRIRDVQADGLYLNEWRGF